MITTGLESTVAVSHRRYVPALVVSARRILALVVGLGLLLAVPGGLPAIAGATGVNLDAGWAQAQDDHPLRWTAPVNLSNSPDVVSRYPDIAVDRTGRVHVVWVEHTTLQEVQSSRPDLGRVFADSDSLLMYTSQAEETWSQPVDIAFGPQSMLLPNVAVDSQGSVHVVYWYGGHHWHLTSRAGSNPSDSRSWGNLVDISQAVSSEAADRFPNLLIDSQDILHLRYTAREDEADQGGRLVWYTQSRDEGFSWDIPVLVGGSGDDTLFKVRSYDADFAISAEGVLHTIVSEDGKAVHALSQDNGASWDERSPIVPGYTQSGYVAVVGDTIHLLWSDAKGALYNRWSTDGGLSWSPDVQLADSGLNLYGGVALAHDSLGRLLLAYPMGGDVWTRLWAEGDWSRPVNVSQSADQTDFWPRMVVSGGNQAHLVWYSGFQELSLFDATSRLQQGEYEIRYARALLDAPAVLPEAYEVVAAIPTPTPQPSPTAEEVLPLPEPTATATVFLGDVPREPLSPPQVPFLVGLGSALVILAAAAVITLRTR